METYTLQFTKDEMEIISFALLQSRNLLPSTNYRPQVREARYKEIQDIELKLLNTKYYVSK